MSPATPYSIARELILANKLRNLDELVLVVKKTNLALDMQVSPKRLNRLLDNPGSFKIEDAYKMAALIGVPADPILKLLSAEYVTSVKRRK